MGASWKPESGRDRSLTLKENWAATKVRGFAFGYRCLLRMARFFGRHKRPYRLNELEILLTGSFYSGNWAIAHLGPLASMPGVKCVHVVTNLPIDIGGKLLVHRPPTWLEKLLGGVAARLVIFFIKGIKHKPHVVGGYHMTMNGMAAALLAPMIGARSLYNCCGGPSEVIGGGFYTENRLFGRLPRPDAFTEKVLIETLGTFDFIIARGSDAVDSFKNLGVEANYKIITAGVDDRRFNESNKLPKIHDILFVGRLVAVKRVDLLLRAAAILIEGNFPELRLTIVGDGEERRRLMALSKSLGIIDNVHFALHQDDVENFLKEARVFVLASESEGMSIALIEAMMCGVPAVVSDVGSLSEIVSDGENGFLIRSDNPTDYAVAISKLLGDHERWEGCSKAAVRAASKSTIIAVAQIWSDTFAASAAGQDN